MIELIQIKRMVQLLIIIICALFLISIKAGAQKQGGTNSIDVSIGPEELQATGKQFFSGQQ